MFKNYFTIAVRNFLRHKSLSFINLAGLAIGLASVIMILSYVQYELSYDKHYSNAERTYRLVQVKNKENTSEEFVFLPEGLAGTFQKELPEVEATTCVYNSKFNFLRKGENISVAALHADSGFFKVFNLSFIYGNPETALKENRNIVITEKVAKMFFKSTNPVGEKLNSKSYDGSLVIFTITGVIKDIPPNTHFKGDVITANNKTENLSWSSYSAVPQYILLRNKTDLSSVENKLKALYPKYDFPKDTKIKFQPATSIHLHSNIADEPFVNSDIRYVYIFSLTAFLILFIACINYINLTTARSLQRVKEVGIRKVLGAGRKQLSYQFIGESFLFFCSAIPFALLIAHSFWPLFIKILNIEPGNNYLMSPQNILIISAISIISGIASGVYPSFFLSKLQPVTILKDWQKSFKVNLGIRKTLIVLQFVISVTLIISTIVIYKQLHFINNMPLGFNKDHLIVVPFQTFQNSPASFVNELKKNSNIKSVSTASWNIGERYAASASMDKPGDSTKEIKFNFVDADFDFLKTMEVSLVDGRDFSTAYPSDLVAIDSVLHLKKYSNTEYENILASRPIIITENTADALQVKHPVGQTLKFGALQGTVIGIIKDFQGLSLHQKASPLVIRASPAKLSGYTYVRISAGNTQATVSYIQATWKKFFPESKFDFSFADERLQKLYDSERRLASLFTVFAVLAICIACSGLFSLVALIVQQRTKEIGIRKVLGANVGEIVELISKDFLLLITIAILVASPIAWYAMNSWLQNFAYRINVSWWLFVVAGAVVITIALITISIQAIKAAIANPVKSLRTE
ncbi:MAG: putative transport system permease protein [Segetibacter sp.]|nr:putative transport system permease protein [Segetibacter sp.]